ncbi:unnamed protein product [Paramecium pentaurelia]|uniref:Uncharacterized protein n=1 Tax=Paramecium pentaurelia TaxID=43138 RepID=A0A8S1UX14_9CILI|nr:unnamed protein product [Paramecium pentaurelia]
MLLISVELKTVLKYWEQCLQNLKSSLKFFLTSYSFWQYSINIILVIGQQCTLSQIGVEKEATLKTKANFMSLQLLLLIRHINQKIILKLGANIHILNGILILWEVICKNLNFQLHHNTLGQIYQLKHKIVSRTVQQQIESRSQSVMIGTSYAGQYNIKIDIDITFLLVIYNKTFSQYDQMRASSIISTAPALKLSDLP